MHTSKELPQIPPIIRAIRAALEVTQSIQANLNSKDCVLKDDQSPVTIADLAAQVIINQSLLELDPQVRIVGEEDSEPLKQDPELAQQVLAAVQQWRTDFSMSGILSAIDAGNDQGGADGTFWTLDPIDGTKGFLRGEQYALALAQISNGMIQQGFLGCPNLPNSNDGTSDHKVFYASKGQGAWGLTAHDEPQPIHVVEVHDLKSVKFCESVEQAHSSHSSSSRIAEQLGIVQAPYRIDSQCKYAAVARGDASIYLRLPVKKDYEEKIWDHAAGVILITEAGGKVTDVHGKALNFGCGRTLAENQGVIVTNGTFHNETLNAVQRELGL